MINVEDVFAKLLDVSKSAYNKRSETTGVQTMKVKNHKLCLELYNNGWVQNGFEYLDNSTDIITFWTKDKQRTKVKLNLYEQQLWVRELDLLKARGKI